MLFLDSGAYGYCARRAADPPPILARTPDPARERARGALLACAEGVAERPDGDAAARAAIRALGESFYAAPETWGPQQSLSESIQAAHLAVRAGNDGGGRAAVISAVVLHRRRWLVAHAGNTRVYLYRDHQLRQLTRDHLLPRPVKRARIERACGLHPSLEPEIYSGELEQNDLFLITTAGAHEALSGARVMSVLESDATAQQMAEDLVRHACAAATGRDISVCLARVEKLPPPSVSDADDVAALPLIAPPEPGTILDNFSIERRVHKSRDYVLYRAVDRLSGDTVALRFPRPGAREESAIMQRFLREEWISKRVRHPSLVPLRALPDGRRSALYSVMEYQRGENLTKRIKRRDGLALREALLLGRQLLEVLEALHAQGIVHRDLRPSNLLYDKHERRLIVLGLDASRVQSLSNNAGKIPSGGLSYAAPEVLNGAEANERSDVYAAGVTLYRMITAHYPYGKITSAKRWPAHEYTPMTRHKADVPEAVERAIARACAADPGNRYAGAAQFLAALPEIEANGQRAAKKPTTGRAALPWHWLLIAVLLAGLVGYVVTTFR